jgi:hypothetical protein
MQKTRPQPKHHKHGNKETAVQLKRRLDLASSQSSYRINLSKNDEPTTQPLTEWSV